MGLEDIEPSPTTSSDVCSIPTITTSEYISDDADSPSTRTLISTPCSESKPDNTDSPYPHRLLPQQAIHIYVTNSCSNLSLANSCSLRNLDLALQAPVLKAESEPLTCKEKLKRTQNLWVISVGFMLAFSAFNAMQNLATTLLQKDSLGLISLSCVYGFAIFSCFFSPWLIKKVTPKWTIVTSFILLTLYLGSMLYPKHYSVIPTSVLLGLSNGPLWTAASLYITTTAMNYAVTTGGSVPVYISQFTGIWMMFQQTSQIIGNLISSLVLEVEAGLADIVLGRKCGVEFDLNWTSNLTSQIPSETAVNSTINNHTAANNLTSTNKLDAEMDESILILGCTYVVFTVWTTIISVIFLRKFEHCSCKIAYGSVVSVVDVLIDQLPTKQLLMSTFHLMKHEKMYLTIPLCYMTGMQMVYLFGSFTQAYVSCGLGIENIGFTMIAFGVSNALGCYTAARLYPILGRIPLFTLAFLLNLALYVTMLMWTPTSDLYVIYYALPTVWGMVDSILQPQTMAFMGYLFPARQEIAFSNFHLFKNLGMATTFAYSAYLRMRTKLYLAIGLSVFSMVAYYRLEWRIRQPRTRPATQQKSSDQNS